MSNGEHAMNNDLTAITCFKSTWTDGHNVKMLRVLIAAAVVVVVVEGGETKEVANRM